MPRFFSREALTHLTVGQDIVLPEAVFHHAIRVRRLQQDDTCTLFDGSGDAWHIRLSHLEKKQAIAQVESHEPADPPPSLHITLALAVTAAERMDWALQKATELGAAAFLPLYSTYSNARLDGERLKRRDEHWQGILASACEQCGQNRLPTLVPVQTFDAAVNAANDAPGTLRIMLDASANESLPTLLDHLRSPPVEKGLMMIGPEGGFTAQELHAAQAAGWLGARLGPRILRAETAAATAVTLLQARLGDLA